MNLTYLPITKADLLARGIDQPDFVFVSGDAYVDHPSFGTAIIARVLEYNGFSVAILPQPDWRKPESIRQFGEPRLGFLVSSGNMDSMVNHYSVSKTRRKKDFYSPGGAMGRRPDYATTVYGQLIRQSYPKIPIIVGGIEASLRRFAHYDYWSDTVKRSILLDSKADILLYGMGERAVIQVAEALRDGVPVDQITNVKGTVYLSTVPEAVPDATKLPAFDKVSTSRALYAKSFFKQYQNTDPFTAKTLVEAYQGPIFVIQNPPQPPLTASEMDAVYALPFARNYHPSYEKAGGVPAIEEVKFSLISSRGCFGSCNFCALSFHQGRIIQGRSHESLVEEAKQMIAAPDFKGYIHDVGGPTANFRKPACQKQLTHGACKNRQCLFPHPCEQLEVDHSDYLALLRKLRALPKVKKVFVRSGIRFDYLIKDGDETFFRELVEHHISGQLKVAPEHVSDAVLQKMGKPENAVYRRFIKRYQALNQELGKNQFVVPYLMSSHPGSTLRDAISLAEYLRDLGHMPEQVQDFYPTPSTISTCMYYTGLDPRTMEPVFSAKTPREKAMQRALIQYRDPKNYDLVVEALLAARRTDLIGNTKTCLVRPKAGDVRLLPKTAVREKRGAKNGGKNPRTPIQKRNTKRR